MSIGLRQDKADTDYFLDIVERKGVNLLDLKDFGDTLSKLTVHKPFKPEWFRDLVIVIVVQSFVTCHSKKIGQIKATKVRDIMEGTMVNDTNIMPAIVDVHGKEGLHANQYQKITDFIESLVCEFRKLKRSDFRKFTQSECNEVKAFLREKFGSLLMVSCHHVIHKWTFTIDSRTNDLPTKEDKYFDINQPKYSQGRYNFSACSILGHILEKSEKLDYKEPNQERSEFRSFLLSWAGLFEFLKRLLLSDPRPLHTDTDLSTHISRVFKENEYKKSVVKEPEIKTKRTRSEEKRYNADLKRRKKEDTK